jgi:hypothetical protein
MRPVRAEPEDVPEHASDVLPGLSMLGWRAEGVRHGASQGNMPIGRVLSGAYGSLSAYVNVASALGPLLNRLSIDVLTLVDSRDVRSR